MNNKFSTKILGIDYGRKKVGLAFSESGLAEPLKVILVENFDEAIGKVKGIMDELRIERIVVGVSEGEMGEESRRFANELGAETFDETLSSQDAQRLSREAGIGQKRRREMEDAFAATIMLQNYLDNND